MDCSSAVTKLSSLLGAGGSRSFSLTSFFTIEVTLAATDDLAFLLLGVFSSPDSLSLLSEPELESDPDPLRDPDLELDDRDLDLEESEELQ